MATPTVGRDRIPHPPATAIDLATVMRTVGDPLRLDIVRLLADGHERRAASCPSALDLPASTASYHLRLLREAGVTRTRAAACTASSACGATISRSASPASSTS